MNKNVIPVFFTIDNNYAPYLDCAIRSMKVNASKDFEYRIIVLHQDLTELNIHKLKESIEDPFQIEFIEMKDIIDGITDRAENRLRCDYFTLTIYYRLFIADMFPEYDKGIYIDSDIVVPGDISEMFQMDLGDNLIGACPDHSVAGIPELARYMEYTIGTGRHEYINSGVLLLNLNELRRKYFSKKFLYLLNTYHFDCIAPDQDYLNAMCHGRILYLDECWDAMPPEEGSRAPLSNPKLIHYNLFQKPWCYDGVPYEEFFWKYAKDSSFYPEIVEYKMNYSKEQKASDKACLKLLIQKAGSMDQKKITFKKIMDSGECIRI